MESSSNATSFNDAPLAPSLNTNDILLCTMKNAMSLIWGKTPNRFQSIVIPSLLVMNHPKNKARGVFVVQATGGGKLMVYQCSGTIFRGVNLII